MSLQSPPIDSDLKPQWDRIVSYPDPYRREHRSHESIGFS